MTQRPIHDPRTLQTTPVQIMPTENRYEKILRRIRLSNPIAEPLNSRGWQRIALACSALALGALSWTAIAQDSKPAAKTDALTDAKPNAKAAAPKPALTVGVVAPQAQVLAQRISANGSVAPWQELSVGAESNGLRLLELRANVGDMVRKGQVLATFADASVRADVAQAQAALAEAQSAATDAAGNAERARSLGGTGALSAQHINQFLSAETATAARVLAQKAALQSQQLRLTYAVVVAPDAGVVMSRAATVGAVLPAGFELFRIIRQNRLEWRAEVTSAELARIKPGMAVLISLPGDAKAEGKVRSIAPTVDVQTRNALVYVDVSPGAARAGMFARGDLVTGSAQGLTLPASAVVLRDGFSTVMRLDPGNKVTQVKVGLGKREAERIEITQGLDPKALYVATGAAFLADGDTVRVSK